MKKIFVFVLLLFSLSASSQRKYGWINKNSAPSLVEVLFTTTYNLSYDNSTFIGNTYWKPTVTGTPVWADGIASVGIPSGQDGYVQTDINYTITTQQFGLCLHTSSTVSSNPFYSIASYMVYKHVTGAYYTGEAGSFVNTGVTAADGDKLRLRRTGTTVYADYYRSGSWTNMGIFISTTSAKLYVGCSADNANAYEVQILNVKGYNVL